MLFHAVGVVHNATGEGLGNDGAVCGIIGKVDRSHRTGEDGNIGTKSNIDIKRKTYGVVYRALG